MDCIAPAVINGGIIPLYSCFSSWLLKVGVVRLRFTCIRTLRVSKGCPIKIPQAPAKLPAKKEDESDTLPASIFSYTQASWRTLYRFVTY